MQLLTDNENNNLTLLLGPRCVALSSAVVCIYLANGKTWYKYDCGVACYIKDYSKRSFFIRVFNVEVNRLTWEQEIFREFDYQPVKSFFHILTADTCYAGLSFTSDLEADCFFDAIAPRLHSTSNRGRSCLSPACPTPLPAVDMIAASIPTITMPEGIETWSRMKDKKTSSGKGERKKITKREIGMPTDFRHVQHLGYSVGDYTAVECFNQPQPLQREQRYSNADLNTMHSMLREIGQEDLLTKEENIHLVYSIIQEHGGMEKAKIEIAAKRQSPQLLGNDQASILSKPAISVRGSPPATPSRKPSTLNNHRPPPPPVGKPLSINPTTSPMSDIPPPPPLPPPVVPPLPRVTPATNGSSANRSERSDCPTPGGGKGALLVQIHKFDKDNLKPTESMAPQPPKNKPGGIFEAIIQGIAPYRPQDISDEDDDSNHGDDSDSDWFND